MYTRNDILNKSLNLIKEREVTILQFPTGLGKTYIALKAIEQEGGNWYIILAERAHKKNWLDEIDKWQLSHLLPKITFFLYASLHKYQNAEVDGIVLDEMHHLFTNQRVSFTKSINRKKTIGLSATLKYEHLKALQCISNPKNIRHEKRLEAVPIIKGALFPISLQNAIDWKILPKPSIYLIPIELDNLSRTETIIKTKGTKTPFYEDIYPNRFKYLGKEKNYTLHIKCTQQEEYEDINGLMDYFQKLKFKAESKYKKTPNEANLKAFKTAESLWLRQGLKRKNFLSKHKIPIAKKLITTLQNKRFICFANSIAEIKELGYSTAVHSNNNSNKNQELIDSFNNKEIYSLFAVGMLKEGMNLNDIDCGIMTQLSGTQLNNTQILGRSLRSEEPEQYIIYIKNTQDEKYLENMLKEFNKNLIQELNI